LPASFARLRIAGFKSFAEPATLEVLPGLTGIVGPNGCGKSNVVEALRWAMGETSARNLRGEDMDDVIFAGTTERPARNLAEVVLVLEDTLSLAPPPFHELDQLEITRRIERGAGSQYRINGREARARDVQTLFADLASGARASAMVSQGRVGALVSAKPEDRRSILEEAAGITGLHARRHEAELKLRAAEANLMRAEDLRGQLETQLEHLRRQARQAARYRTISAAIRNAEAELLSLQHARADAARKQATQQLATATEAVARAAAASVAASAEADQAMLRLPGLRETEAQARTALERHRLAGEQIAADIARAQQALATAREQAARLEQDVAHAERQEQDAREAMERLDAEAARLAGEQEAHPALAEAAEAAALAAADAVRACDAAANRATEHAADLAARHRALAEAMGAARQREKRLREQLAGLEAEQSRLAASLVPGTRLAEARARAEAAEAAFAETNAVLEQAERARLAALAEASALRETAGARAAELRRISRDCAETSRRAANVKLVQARQAAQDAAETVRRAAGARLAGTRETAQRAAEAVRHAAMAKLAGSRETSQRAAAARTLVATEHQALAKVLGVADGERWPKLIDQLTVPPGLEDALGAVLGEELAAAADPGAARHWRAQPPSDLPALPDGATPLSTLVQGPELLTRALSQIGLAAEVTPELLAALRPGQSLLTESGGVWRWDGYTIRPGTGSAAALRLQQRNRLAALSADLAAAEAEAGTAAAALAAAEAEAKSATTQAERDLAATLAAAEAEAKSATAQADREEAAAREAAEAESKAVTAQAEREEAAARAEAERLEFDAATRAKTSEAAATEAERAARSARSAAESVASHARADSARLEAQSAAAAARAAGLVEQQTRLAAEHQEAARALATAEAEAAGLGDQNAAREAQDSARASLAAAHTRDRDAAAARDTLTRAEAARSLRSQALGPERAIFADRLRDAGFRRTDLLARRAQSAAEIAILQEAPARLEAQRLQAGETLEAALAVHQQAASRMATEEAAFQEADRAARAAEQTLAFARETSVRAEGEVHQANHVWGAVAERILERLGSSHDLPPPPPDPGPDAEDRFRRRHERLLKEREEMGPVNLRAEIEANALEEQIATITREREEIATAIAKLRGSIGHLNREGRERLTAVFAQVDTQFQALFTRMFNGGRAHLALVGSDDPLTAGLEIYAQPPGKKLAALSLLSGGEQALTALSLIFAVFRCNPAPICVLDEVDAPLDDANVERFCTLLEDMVTETGTRFLVVTHHALTMARMDRLYGVTMQERGVSRVLSVDLQRAAAMVEGV
jgi:chromosome segregation protein